MDDRPWTCLDTEKGDFGLQRWRSVELKRANEGIYPSSFVADQWPHMCENYRPESPYSAKVIVERATKQRINSGAEPADINKWQTPFYYPTLQLGLEFKKSLPSTGVEWLFVRARARKIENGRFDVEVTILDEERDIVAVAIHVVFIVANEHFSGSSENKSSSKI